MIMKTQLDKSHFSNPKWQFLVGICRKTRDWSFNT